MRIPSGQRCQARKWALEWEYAFTLQCRIALRNYFDILFVEGDIIDGEISATAPEAQMSMQSLPYGFQM